MLLTSVVLIAISLVGGLIQHSNINRRIYNSASLIGLVGATVLDLLYSRPLIVLVQNGASKINSVMTKNLYWISVFHAVSAGLLLMALSCQLSIEELDEAQEVEETKAKTE